MSTNNNTKKVIIPVTYEVYGTITIEGDFKSFEEAIKYFNENKDEISLPFDTEYVDGSFNASVDNSNDLKLFNPDITFNK